MIRFVSTCDALLDDKGRVVLPSSYKKTLGELAEEPLIIEKDIYEPCLNIYPEKFWNEHLLKIESRLNPLDSDDVYLLTQIYANYTKVTMAPNGRINIPSNYLTYAKLEKEVLFVGKGLCIGLWDERSYNDSVDKKPPFRELFKQRLGNQQKDT